jgi:hypothetical protein
VPPWIAGSFERLFGFTLVLFGVQSAYTLLAAWIAAKLAASRHRFTSPELPRWNSAPPADVTVPLSPDGAVAIHRSDRDPTLRSYQSHSTRRSSDVVVVPVRGFQSDASVRHQDFYRVAPQHQRAF